MNDIIAELLQLKDHAISLGSLIKEANAMSPRQAEGTDRNGAVRITLGPDGMPLGIKVAADWQQRAGTGAFGGAVLDAFQAAVGERMAAWTRTLEREGWIARAGRVRDTLERPSPAHASAAVPPAFRRDTFRPRPLDDLAEDVIKALDAAVSEAARPPARPEGTGRAAAGRITVTLAPGTLAGCAADSRWASQQTPEDLATAFGQALSAAREQLRLSEQAATATAGQRAGQLDQLFAETLAILTDAQHTTPPGAEGNSS
jgi:hypothetical protein